MCGQNNNIFQILSDFYLTVGIYYAIFFVTRLPICNVLISNKQYEDISNARNCNSSTVVRIHNVF